MVGYRALYGNRWFNLLGAGRTNLPWRVWGMTALFDEPIHSANAASLDGLTARLPTGLKSSSLTWRLTTPLAQGYATTAIRDAGPNAVRDRAGNAINAFNQSFAVLLGDFDGNRVVDLADEAAVRGLQGGPYQPGGIAYNPWADLSGDGLINLIDVGISRSRRGTFLGS